MDSPDVVKGSLGWPGDGKGRGQGGLGRGMWCDIQEQAGSVTSRPQAYHDHLAQKRGDRTTWQTPVSQPVTSHPGLVREQCC